MKSTCHSLVLSSVELRDYHPRTRNSRHSSTFSKIHLFVVEKGSVTLYLKSLDLQTSSFLLSDHVSTYL